MSDRYQDEAISRRDEALAIIRRNRQPADADVQQQSEDAIGPTADEIDAMTKDEVRAFLEDREIEHDGRAGVDDLRQIAKESLG